MSTLPRILTTLCLLLPVVVWAQGEKTISRRFSTQNAPTFSADLLVGGVNIESWDEPAIQVDIKAAPRREVRGDPEALMAPLTIELDQKQNVVSLRTRYGRDLYWSWENTPFVEVQVTVKVPRHTHVNLVTIDGSVTLSQLTGDLSVENRFGPTFFGPTVGNIRATSLRGDVSVASCTGKVDIRTASGRIQVGRVDGPAKVVSSGGDIEVQQAFGGVEALGNGSNLTIGLGRPLNHPAKVTTSGGNIVLKLDRDEACLLDSVVSPFGSIRVVNLDFDVLSGGLGQSWMRAAVNANGGPRIQLAARGGNVLVRGLDPLIQFGQN